MVSNGRQLNICSLRVPILTTGNPPSLHTALLIWLTFLLGQSSKAITAQGIRSMTTIFRVCLLEMRSIIYDPLSILRIG